MALIPQPIFLVGAHRSGTTLLRLMIDHHPQISFKFESEYITSQITAPHQFPELNQYYEYLECDRIFTGNKVEIKKDLSYAELVNDFLLQSQAKTQKPLVGTTVHVNFSRLIDIWPDARFIYLCRDPRDVARSAIDMGWAGNVWFGADGWLHAEALWKELKTSLSDSQIMEIQYEELITQPEPILTKICEFLGVEYSPEMLSYPNDTTYSLPNKSLLQQWKRKLSDSDVQLVESRTGDLLVKRGYQLSGLEPLIVSPQQLTKLRLEDKSKVLQFRINRYGLGLTLLDIVARKLGIKPLQKTVRLRLNQIAVKYLK